MNGADEVDLRGEESRSMTSEQRDFSGEESKIGEGLEKMLPGERFDERVVAAAFGFSHVVGRPARCLADNGLDEGEGSVNNEGTGDAWGDALMFLMVTGAFGGDFDDDLVLESSRPNGRSSVDFGLVKFRPPVVLLRGRDAAFEVPDWN